MDYDKKFQEDLEKAAALSLETLALEQFRRNKFPYSSATDVSTSSTGDEISKSSTCKLSPKNQFISSLQVQVHIVLIVSIIFLINIKHKATFQYR